MFVYMKTPLSFFVILLCVVGVTSLAANGELSSPGILPDSPFYFLKTWKESIQTFFTFGAENKAEQYLHLAEVRLAEYQKMIEKGKIEIAERTFEKYERQLDRALEKVDEARMKGKDVGDITEEIKEKEIKHMEVLNKVSETMSDETKQDIFEDRAQKWLDFISAVKERYPGAISHPPEDKANLPAKLILNCPVPKLPEEGSCRGEWLFQSGGNCPYFACSDDGKMPVTEPPIHAADLPVWSPESKVCTQVITPAMSPDGRCREFSTPCDVPEGWKKADRCAPASSFSIPPSSISVPSVSPVLSKPTTPAEPAPTEIRYYTCPDGTKVESGKCYAGGGCTIQINPERQCPQITTPVERNAVCTTAGEIKYFKCSDGTQIPWCACGPEGGWAGAQNKWQCQYYPVGYTCPKAVAAPAPVGVACCFGNGLCQLETKEECIAKGAAVSGSSCSPNPCPQPAPKYNECKIGETKTHQCPDGTLITTANCLDGRWNDFLFADVPLTELCPVLDDVVAPVISDIVIDFSAPHIPVIRWKTNEAASSYVEYGLTISYGSETEIDYLKINHAVALMGLEQNTAYHFRIIAEDVKGNKAVSKDRTVTREQ